LNTPEARQPAEWPARMRELFAKAAALPDAAMREDRAAAAVRYLLAERSDVLACRQARAEAKRLGLMPVGLFDELAREVRQLGAQAAEGLALPDDAALIPGAHGFSYRPASAASDDGAVFNAKGCEVLPWAPVVERVYDDPEGRMRVSGRVLRLRRAADTALLTYKGAASFAGGVKVREERETRVSDPEEMEAILVALGWKRRFRYEKRREEWTFEGCAVALDETPIGNFVEVEGDPRSIRRALVALGLDFAKAVPYSYARLYAERRKTDPTLPADMIFK